MSKFNRPKREDFPYFPNNVKILEGFNVESLLPGCRTPDCIPSIDKPKWIGDKEFDDDEMVLGTLIIKNNQIIESFAIPITILDYHEIVNFEYKGKLLAITYCPLCQTATAYERYINEEEIELGVSGLLYNSALVLFDRKSNSLFSQVWSRGITGKYTGCNLTQIPLFQTTLKEWHDKFPNGKILSKETGFNRKMNKYGEYPYGDYKQSNKIIFPIHIKDQLMFVKELVFTVELDKTYIIKMSDLTKEIQHNTDFYSIPFAGGRLFFKGNKNNIIIWENWIPSGISFYFAARNYYPNALIL